jgi:hypothetical protein
MKKLITLGIALAMFSTMIMPITAFAATTSVTTGEVIIGSALPSIATVSFGATLDPSLTAALTVHVDDASTLDNLAQIWVVLAYEATDTDQDLSGKGVGETAIPTLAIFKWEPTGGFQTVGPATEWSVTGTAPSPLTATSGDFVFNIVVSDVARYAPGGSQAGWDVYIKVTDKTTPVANVVEDDTSLTDLAMAAFASVNVNDNSISFGSLDLGDTDQPLSDPVSGYFITTPVSNRTYALQIQTENWDDGSTHTITLDTDGASLADNSFSIRADDDPTIPDDSQFLTTSAVNLTGHETDSPSTTVAGVAVNTYLWITLAANMYPTTYTGTITMTLVQ